MLKKNDIIYNKYGDLATVEFVEDGRITIILQRTQLFNEGGSLKRTQPKPETLVISEDDFGIKYFYQIEDIGDMGILTDPMGSYAKNIQAIQENYEKEIVAHAKVLPTGERMNESRKQQIIDSYFDTESEMEKERDFISRHEDCFGRIDLDTRFGVGHGIKYFQSRHHDKCYISKDQYRRLPDGTHIVNWRSSIADFYYNQDKTFDTSPFYLDIFDASRSCGVPGIEYDYTLMLKRKFATNPFTFLDLYIGGERSRGGNESGINIYENGSVDPFLIQIIEEKRLQHKLSDIIISIQTNQNAMIRHEYKKNMLVQGCAGSGKTMILLHRISYLKYNNYLRNFDKAVIIVPNNNFDLFIDELSENLEIDKIPRMTMRQYYLKLAVDYQKVLDRGFGSSIKSIENQFEILSNSDFIGTNATQPDEVFSDDYEYKLCDFYDQSIKDYYNQIELDIILSITERFGIKFDAERAGYEQLNELYSIVNEKGNIWSVYHSMEDNERRKMQSVENEWKKYEEIISTLKNLLVKLTHMNKSFGADVTIKQVKSKIGEKKRLEEYIAEKEKSVDKARKESENAPKGFLRLLSNASNISKDRLENEIKELDALKDKYEKLNSLIPNDSINIINDVLKQLAQTIEIVDRRRNTGSTFYNGCLERLWILLEQIENGALSAKKGIEEICIIGSEIEESTEANNIIIKYEKRREDLNKVIALKPDEKESEILKNAANALRNRRMFVSRLFKKFAGIEISEIDKGLQVFTLIALYCLHIGRLNSDLECIFIDEGQDYSESEYRILRTIHKDSCCFEVYGDVAQCVTPNRGLKNWDYLRSLFDADYFEMKENYRNTVEIAEYINENVMNAFNIIGFRGPEVVEKRMPWGNVIMDVINTNKGDRIAVICHNKNDIEGLDSATKSYLAQNGFLYNVIGAKGLEFEVVFVIDRNMSLNEKYVAFSRSLKDLIILK